MQHRLSPADQPHVLELFLELREPTSSGLKGWTEKRLKEELVQAQGFVWKAPDVQAFLLYRRTPIGAEITLLASAPKIRKKGVMKQLIGSLIRSLEPGEEVWLEVHEGNISARNLYKAMGFQEVGLRPRYYPDGGSCVNLAFKA